MSEDEQEKTKGGGTRGTSYPFVSLKEAVERARVFFDHEGKNAAPVGAAIEHWGYGAKSSGGRQTVAAMLSYGLMRDEGSGEQRRVALTKMALDILLAEPDSESRRTAIRAAGRAPKLYREILSNYPEGLPSDTTLRHFLIAQVDVSPSAVPLVIKNFRDTAAFAELYSSAIITPKPAAADEAKKVEAKVGDLIQWESNGVLQFEKPRRVRAVQQHEGADWVFVEGSATGIPMLEVTVEGRSEGGKAAPQAPILPEEPASSGEREWIRGPLAKGINYRILVSGDLGPREITKLIRLLEAQKLVLSDDEEETAS